MEFSKWRESENESCSEEGWSDGVMEWWSDGVVEWWSGGVVE